MLPKSQTEFISLVIFFSTIFFSQLGLQSPILRWLRPKAAPRLNGLYMEGARYQQRRGLLLAPFRVQDRAGLYNRR